MKNSIRIQYDFQGLYDAIAIAREKGNDREVRHLQKIKAKWMSAKRKASYSRRRRRLIKSGKIFIPKDRQRAIAVDNFGESHVFWFNACGCHPNEVIRESLQYGRSKSTEGFMYFKSRRSMLARLRRSGYQFVGEL